jgi:hypothetical protein
METWPKDEAEGMTIKSVSMTSERLKVVPQRVIQ